MLQLSTKRTRPLKLTASIAAELQTERIYFGNRMMWLAPDTMLLGTAANVFRCVFKGNNLVSTTALLSSDKKGFINSFYYAAIANNVKSVEELNEVAINGSKVTDMINDKLAAIGEKIAISRFERVEAPYVASYIHGAYRMGVLVGLTAEAENAGKDVAMQIAAMNPLAVDESSIPADVIEREKNIAIEVVKAEGKPAEMAEKIAMGKLNKFFKENTLLAQAFVKDNNQSVGDYLKTVAPDLKVTAFKRVALG